MISGAQVAVDGDSGTDYTQKKMGPTFTGGETEIFSAEVLLLDRRQTVPPEAGTELPSLPECLQWRTNLYEEICKR